MKKNLIAAINFYQKTLSPDTGLFKDCAQGIGCRHYPRCSEYVKIAVENQGILKGLWLGLKRIARCQPWQSGGLDFSCNLEKK